jgi:hypothetical protein
MQRNVEQFNGREGETATLFGNLRGYFGGLCGGFAPRHLNRSALRGCDKLVRYVVEKQLEVAFYCLEFRLQQTRKCNFFSQL